MPSLKAFLKKTMIFTAAQPADLYSLKLGASDPIVPTPPTPTTSGDEETRPVWNWTHDPNSPAKITNLTAIVRAMNNMTMTVCDSIEVERVTVSARWAEPIELPLDLDHVVAKFKLAKGHITRSDHITPPPKTQGWWRIESNTDWSMAVVFGYELVGEDTSAPVGICPVDLSDLEKDDAFGTPDVGTDDPDYMDPDDTPTPTNSAAGTVGDPKTLQNSLTIVPPRHFVIVVFGFTTCMERADFEPGGVLGAGRFYPHVTVTSNRALFGSEATIRLERPAKGMTDDEMNGKIAPLLATDTNSFHGPVPLWSNVFDYVVTDPVGQLGLVTANDKNTTGSNWMRVVDPMKGARTIVGKIKRETILHIPSLVDTANFTKVARQGEFDNLHVAPGMVFNPLFEKKQDNIKMAPFCVHDCMHTHFRWGSFLLFMPKSNKGFTGRQPYAEQDAPLVPSDQTVKIGLTSGNSFRYFAMAGSKVKANTWTVFNHHGSGYALGVASNTKWWGARGFVYEWIGLKREPYGILPSPPLLPIAVVSDFDPLTSVAAFYFRLRFTGIFAAGAWVERLQILDLSATTGVRS